MNDTDYIAATRRTDPEDGYAEDGAIALRLGREAALLHYALGIVTEAGELADALKKALIYGKPLDRVNLIEEIGDLQWYEARMLDHLGSSFSEARARNIAKLRKRYPDGFTEEDAIVRDLDAEREILARREHGFERAFPKGGKVPVQSSDPSPVFRWCRCEEPQQSVSDGDEVSTCLACGGFGGLRQALGELSEDGEMVPEQKVSRVLRDLALAIDLGCDDTDLEPERLDDRIHGLIQEAVSGTCPLLPHILLRMLGGESADDVLAEFGLLDG